MRVCTSSPSATPLSSEQTLSCNCVPCSLFLPWLGWQDSALWSLLWLSQGSRPPVISELLVSRSCLHHGAVPQRSPLPCSTDAWDHGAVLLTQHVLMHRLLSSPSYVFSLSFTWSEVKSLSRVWLFATPWTAARQAPLFMGFSRQEYWSGLPFPSPGDFPNPGIKPGSPALQADASSFEPPGKPIVFNPILPCPLYLA